MVAVANATKCTTVVVTHLPHTQQSPDQSWCVWRQLPILVLIQLYRQTSHVPQGVPHRCIITQVLQCINYRNIWESICLSTLNHFAKLRLSLLSVGKPCSLRSGNTANTESVRYSQVDFSQNSSVHIIHCNAFYHEFSPNLGQISQCWLRLIRSLLHVSPRYPPNRERIPASVINPATHKFWF